MERTPTPWKTGRDAHAAGEHRHAIIISSATSEGERLKEGIHPKYYEIEARCACGATWSTRSTKPELRLEICSSCHPFFTGKQKLVDTEGRVERFTKKYGAQTVENQKKLRTARKKDKAKSA